MIWIACDASSLGILAATAAWAFAAVAAKAEEGEAGAPDVVVD